jgi:hypothetical protein
MLEPYPGSNEFCRGSELQYTRTPRCGWKVSVLKTNPHRTISGCLLARCAVMKIMGEQKTKVKNPAGGLVPSGRLSPQKMRDALSRSRN